MRYYRYIMGKSYTVKPRNQEGTRPLMSINKNDVITLLSTLLMVLVIVFSINIKQNPSVIPLLAVILWFTSLHLWSSFDINKRYYIMGTVIAITSTLFTGHYLNPIDASGFSAVCIAATYICITLVIRYTTVSLINKVKAIK